MAETSMRELIAQTKQIPREELRQSVATDSHPADDSYAPPVASVKLPSRGKVYPPESSLYLCEELDVKAMTAKEEDILASPVLIRKGTVLSTLMKACITNRSVDPDQLLVGDRNAILNAIRVSAYGAEYETTIQCPKCNEESAAHFDLGRVPMKTLDVDPDGGPGSNVFGFSLPVWKKRVQFKLLAGSDVVALDKDMERVRKARNGAEAAVTMRLNAQILSIDGNTDRGAIGKMVQNIPARDSRDLRAYMDEIAPSVQMEQEFTCASCGEETVVDIPMGTEFFWPSK